MEINYKIYTKYSLEEYKIIAIRRFFISKFTSIVYSEYHHQLFDDFSDFYIVKRITELISKDDDSNTEAYIDDNTTIFDDEWTAIDLDEFEAALARQQRRDKNKSMDMGFMICQSGRKLFVLVEFRLNYKDVVNVRKIDLDDKVQGSSENISNHLNEEIYLNKYFVFGKKRVEQGRERLRRMNPRCSPTYHACSVQGLFDEFFIH